MNNLVFLNWSEIIEGGNVIVSLSERCLGRVTALDVKNPITGEIIIKKAQMIDEAACEKIDAAGVKIINVYSVITCSSKRRSMCNLSMEEIYQEVKWCSCRRSHRNDISAQSIGEPGTQLNNENFSRWWYCFK